MDTDLIKTLSQGGGMAVALAVLVWTVKTMREGLADNTKALIALRIAFAKADIKVEGDDQ